MGLLWEFCTPSGLSLEALRRAKAPGQFVWRVDVKDLTEMLNSSVFMREQARQNGDSGI
jgi:hypothetical protein